MDEDMALRMGEAGVVEVIRIMAEITLLLRSKPRKANHPITQHQFSKTKIARPIDVDSSPSGTHIAVLRKVDADQD